MIVIEIDEKLHFSKTKTYSPNLHVLPSNINLKLIQAQTIQLGTLPDAIEKDPKHILGST
jgi:cellulose biosynthesis protein BcsQ